MAANADRIQSVLANGSNLIDKRQCAGSEEAVRKRLESIADQWEFLTQKTTEKSMKLKEANKQRTYIAAVKDLDFWLGEVESLLTSEDAGKDLASVQNLMKKHQLVEADIQAHEDRIKGKKVVRIILFRAVTNYTRNHKASPLSEDVTAWLCCQISNYISCLIDLNDIHELKLKSFAVDLISVGYKQVIIWHLNALNIKLINLLHAR